jgi:hypothetical protein
MSASAQLQQLNQEQKGLELEDNLEKSLILFSELVDG